MSLFDQFMAWLLSWVNIAIYVWGGNGEEMTPAKIKKMETSDANYNRALALYNKRLSAGIDPVIGFDCSGLVSRWLQNTKLLNVTSKRNCNHLAKFCEKISPFDGDYSALSLLDLMFRHNGSKPYFHVGVYIGDGEVVESRGRNAGVCISKVDEKASSSDKKKYGHDYYWHRSGTLPIFAQQIDDAVILQRGDKGAEVKHLQEMLLAHGYSLPKYGADSDFGAETETAVKALQLDSELPATGVVDEATWGALQNDEPDIRSATCSGGSVNVRRGPSTEHPILGVAHKGDIMTVMAQENGWGEVHVDAGNKTIHGYMSAKYIQY